MDTDGQEFPSPGAALLLIIGEPFSEDHKQLILEEITKGFCSWDVEETGIDINNELAEIANKASLGEEGANGERLIQHQSDKLTMEILVNPLTQSVKNSFKKLLILPSPNKYIVYAGHAFQGTGSWVLQDDVFSFNSFAQVLKNTDVENALKQNIEASLTIHTLGDLTWGNAISKSDFPTDLRIQLNPSEKMEDFSGVTQFIAYVSTFVVYTPVTKLLQASEQFGNISFTRPTLYIFPGCQGDSALFGINGFNLLVNGGYNRKACFWDFARHLDRVDAMLLTHLGSDNIFGINAALERKSIENIHPQIGYLFFNCLDKSGTTSPSLEENEEKQCSLLVNLAEEANKLIKKAKQLGISPQTCYRSEKAISAEPINLYHKLGHGSLDMYILNPIADTKEIKEFYQNWSKKASNLGSSGPFDLQSTLSVCTMLVWKPHNQIEKIVRIFFPGNAPQHKICDGLEKMKNFAYLKHATCTAKDLKEQKPVKKVAPNARPGSGTTRSSRSTPMSRSDMSRTTTKPESPRKTDMRSSRSGAMSPTKAVSKTSEPPKRSSASTKPKETTKPLSSRATGGTASSQSKSASPRKTTPSPTKSTVKSPTPKSPSPSKSSPLKSSPTKAKSPDIKAEEKPTGTYIIDKSILDDIKAEKKPSTDILNKSELNDSETPKEEIQNSEPESDQVGGDHDKLQSNNSDKKDVPNNSGDNNSFDNNNICSEKLNGHVANADESIHANGDGEEEEVRPQALPEPTAIIEPNEYSTIPDYSSKMESDHKELSEFNQVEEEIDFLKAEEDAQQTEYLEQVKDSEEKDPAEDIPPSPEPEELLSSDFNDYNVPAENQETFETPVFSNDGPDNDSNGGIKAMEQNIEYGIEHSSRAMAGIQEEEEPEEDGDKDQDSSVPAAFDRDSSPEMERRPTEKPTGADLQDQSNQHNGKEEINCHQENGNTFDPVGEWGHPMGLPSPPPVSPQKGSRPATATSSRASSNRTSVRSSATDPNKKRPATAPARGSASSRATVGAKRPGSSRSSPTGVKIPPLPPMTAFYMDLTYIPYHGDSTYCDIEFFKRVRARYYVLSALSPNLKALDSLLEAKATWDQKDLEVTVIPTYDSEFLRHWVGLNKEKLAELRIDLTPAVSRCTIQLQDLETSLPAYRLEV